MHHRLLYADVLRIVAVIAVIVLHTASYDWYLLPVKTSAWQILNVYDSAVRWCVPIFLMLSGMFFLDVEKQIPIKNIYLKYIPRILLALIFWGLLYTLAKEFYIYFIENRELKLEKIISAPLKIIFGPPWYHLWYLYAIISLYILTPFFRVFTAAATRKNIEYFLIVFLAFGLVLPMFSSVLLKINPVYKINFVVPELLGFSGYYFAGYYFAKYELSKKTRVTLYFLGVFSILITIFVTSFVSRANELADAYWYGYLLPTTMFSAYAVFVFIKNKPNKIIFSKKTESAIIYLSSCTFGIYLVHDFVLQLLWRVGFSASSFHPLVSVPIIAAISFLMSLFIVMLLKKVKFLNNRVI